MGKDAANRLEGVHLRPTHFLVVCGCSPPPRRMKKSQAWGQLWASHASGWIWPIAHEKELALQKANHLYNEQTAFHNMSRRIQVKTRCPTPSPESKWGFPAGCWCFSKAPLGVNPSGRAPTSSIQRNMWPNSCIEPHNTKGDPETCLSGEPHLFPSQRNRSKNNYWTQAIWLHACSAAPVIQGNFLFAYFKT